VFESEEDFFIVI